MNLSFFPSLSSVRRAGLYGAVLSFALVLGACGGGGGSPTVGSQVPVTPTPTPDPATTVGSVNVIFSNPELQSSGAAGTEVGVTALVKSATNTAMSGTAVTFTASSGSLGSIDAATDKNGQAKATLSTAGNKENRAITVTATAGGKSATSTINVTGTSLSIGGPAAVASGANGEFTFSLRDSAGTAIANVPLTITSKNGNTVNIKTAGGGTPSAPQTNSLGQVVILLTVTKNGDDVLSVSGSGAGTSTAVAVSSAKLSVFARYSDGSLAQTQLVRACTGFNGRYEVAGVGQNSTVNLTTSRGRLYSDAACTTPLSNSSVAVSNGDITTVYVRSDTAGVATLAAATPAGLMASTTLEFVAPLTAAATISLSADPAVLGTNTSSSKTEAATLTAVVRDGSSDNNLVKGANVEFSLVSDASGGALSTPTLVTTGSDGSATIKFIAGTATTPTDGVRIEARIQGTNTVAASTLTVAKKALFITVGQANSLGTPNASTYQQDFQVFVVDALGNPVQGVNLSASVVPVAYYKGGSTFVPDSGATTSGLWNANQTYSCANEDANGNGILDAGEDFNGNGRLDPGLPASITPNATTNATGTAGLTMLYPKDRAQWVKVKVVVRGSVSGTEAVYVTPAFTLLVLVSDANNKNILPPGFTSPYGVNSCDRPD